MNDIVFPLGDETKFDLTSKKLDLELLKIYKTGQKNIFSSKDNKFILANSSDRSIIESKKINAISEFETEDEKDSHHYRRSGIDQVKAKIMKKRNIEYVVSFNQILKSSKQPMLMGRISQNLEICRKYRVSYRICSCARSAEELRSIHDLNSLLKLLQ